MFGNSFRYAGLIRSGGSAEFFHRNSLTYLVVRDLNLIRYVSTNRKIRHP